MARIRRLPYRINWIVAGTEPQLMLVENGSPLMHGGYPLALPADLACFINAHGVCAHCGNQIAADLARCSCGSPRKTGCHLDVIFKTPFTAESELWTLLVRESRRVKATRRKTLIIEN